MPVSSEIVEPRTCTFKRVGNLELKADVYGADGDVRPAAMIFHGGALIIGERRELSMPEVRACLDAGCVVVSIDYRLAPETKIDGIIEDVRDAWRWLRERGPGLLRIDPDRMAAIGGSAGGYLALMTGCCVEPRPRAIVSFYGYGDIAGPWYSRPDPLYCEQPGVPEEEAMAAVGVDALTSDPPGSDRGRFYLYCRQRGLWPREVTGHDPDAEPRAFDAWCPIRNVTPDYSPTLLLHGDQDTDVPHQQSVDMARELARRGIEHELITMRGMGHGFDMGEAPEIDRVLQRVTAFLTHHLA